MNIHDAEMQLRRFASPHALAFGVLLMARAQEKGHLQFQDFLGAAHDFCVDSPRWAAEYLASLVALDMRQVLAPMAPMPSRN